MNLNEATKSEVKKTIVIYSGRFQPFHKGHYAAYQRLVSKFGADNVYIGTSDKTDGGKSPFNFNDKKKIATTMFGIPSNKFVQLKNPYSPVEILSKYDGKTTQYIAAVGEKDASRLAGKYFKPYKGKAGYGYDEIGYTYIIPSEQNPISGTDVRNGLGSDDEEKSKQFFLKAYPKFNKDVFKMIKSKLNEWGTGNPAGMAGSYDKLNVVDVDDEELNEDGFPGGIGTGLVLPGGYINGAPTGSNENIAEQALADFLKEYFMLNEDESMGGGGEPGGNFTDSVLDDQLFRSAYLPGWDAFDLNGENYANIVGYTMIGHDSKSHIAKTGGVKIPVQNPREENGPAHRSIHPSKGEDYAKEKADRWEMYPFNQRQQNIFKTPDVEAGAGLKSNIVKEENLYDPIGEILSQVITEDIFEEWLDSYLNEEPNPVMDKEITYTSADGKKKKITVRGALRLPKDHEAHKQALKIVGPNDAPANEPQPKKQETPPQPGQPVKKGDTAQGKIDTTPQGGQQGAEQGPPPEQKLSGDELKSSAELSPSEKNAEHMKQALDNARKELSDEENQMIDDVNNPQSSKRKSMMNNIKSGLKQFGKGLKHWADHKKEMVGGTMDAVKALANGQKIGSYKNEQGKWEYSDEKRKEQIHHIKHFALDTGLILGSMAMGGAGVAAAKAAMAGHSVAHAALHGAMGAFTHGAMGFGAHLGKDIAKHASLEALGLKAHHAAGAGSLLSTATMGIMEGVDDSNSNSFIANFMKKAVAIMENYKLSDEQLVQSINDYKKGESQRNASDLLKEGMSSEKQNSINDFIDYATKRLKLEQRPKITLLSGNEYSNEQSSLGGYSPETKEIFVQTHNRLGADILRTIAHEMVHRKQDELGLVKDPLEAGKDGSPIENQAHAVAGILMREYGRRNKQIYQESKQSNKELIMEGGAYGHMNHPFDIQMNLTFGDLKKIINNALDGNLGVVREKTDGQALAISWKKGKLIAARNKSHLANGGANALDISALSSKFAGRGALSDAYDFAMRDLSAAISGLSEKERQSIFKDGSAFCNLEVIYLQNANVIPYGQNLLVFHNVVEYDDKGTAIGTVKGAESKLAAMIKKVNADVQSKYTIQGPPITKLPKNEKLSSQKGKFGGMLSKLQSEFNLSDKDGVAEYHYAWWMNFVNKSKKNLSQLEKEGLARRWAFDNKAFTIKSISDADARKWADGVDKDAKDKIMKGNLRKFEDIFLGVGAEVLSFMNSVLTAQPDSALQSIHNSLETTISQIRSSGSEAQIKRLEKELARLNAIGGFEKLVPNEGLVFFYKGNTYKLTGTFAPLNQILGIFKFGR